MSWTSARRMGALGSVPMTSRIDHTTFDCRDAYALSKFWAQVLGFTDVPGDPNEPGHEECMIIDPSGNQKVLFIEVPEGKQVKNRVHLDVRAAPGLAGGGTGGGDGGIAGAAETGVALGSAGAFADPRNKRPNMLNIQLCLEIGD